MKNETQTSVKNSSQILIGTMKMYVKKIGNFLLDFLCIF